MTSYLKHLSRRYLPKAPTPEQLVFLPYATEDDSEFGYMEHHVTLFTEDGTELNGWFFNRGADKPLVVFYPGKSSHVGYMVQDAANDTERSYLLVNYRGAGWSHGIPSERTMINDARYCLAWSREQSGGHTSLIVAGYSLGTGVAVQIAAAEHANKLILMAPYDTIYEAAVYLTNQWSHLPRPIVETFCGAAVGKMFQSVKYAPQVTCPVTIYFAAQDNVIPHESTWRLYHAFTATHPEAIWFDCRHEMFFALPEFRQSYWEQITGTATPGRYNAPWELVEIGHNYYEGKNGYAKNAAKALEYYRAAADRAFTWGYYNVAKCYLEGQGVTQDTDQAREWYRKAAEQQNFQAMRMMAELGDAEYMTAVGDCYYNGSAQSEGCPHNTQMALSWYLKSADNGYHWGYFNVGKCYVEGKGVPKDDNEARKWFRKAEKIADNPWATRWLAVMGDAEAALRISEYYASGSKENWGMCQDAAEADYFRELAEKILH